MNATPQPLALAQDLDARIREAHARMRRSERDLALLLAELADSRLYLELGYSSLVDYASDRLDLELRKTRGLLRLGRMLPDLPLLDEVLQRGELSWTKARELLAVVTPETQQAWVDLARQTNSRELEQVVAAHLPGEEPTGDRMKESGPVRLVFTVEAVDAELVRTAMATLRAAAGVSTEEVSDGALLADMAQRILEDLEAPDAPTGERFRIVVEHCPRCGHASGEDCELSETHVGQACCDSEVLEMREGPHRGHLSRAIPPATRRAVLQRDHHRCQVPGCSCRLWLDLHHLEYYSEGGDHSEGNLLTVCCIHHRLIHDGKLAVERVEDGLLTRFQDGRVYYAEHASMRSHVGHRGSVLDLPLTCSEAKTEQPPPCGSTSS